METERLSDILEDGTSHNEWPFGIKDSIAFCCCLEKEMDIVWSGVENISSELVISSFCLSEPGSEGRYGGMIA